MRQHRWQWVAPERTLEMAGRAASLTLAISLAANCWLVAVSRSDGWFEWAISSASGVAAAGMLSRIFFPISRISEEATWLACGVWVANLAEIVSTPEVSTAGTFRNGGFYLAFILGSGFLYFIERYARYVRETLAANQQTIEHVSVAAEISEEPS